MEKVIRELEHKRDSFIGSLKDQITVAESRGFRNGLQWAIDVLKTQIEQDELEEQHRQEFEDHARFSSFENEL